MTPTISPAIAAPAAAATQTVDVVDLAVNGRYDNPLGLGDPSPTLAWRMTPGGEKAGNPCFDPSVAGTCAVSKQTGYEIEAAETAEALSSGDLLWDTGRVRSSEQNNVELGVELDSRDTVAWRVRVWDALGNPSGWSDTATFTVGLLEQSDWGNARWIEDAGRAETDPMPIFARKINVPAGKSVASANLYLSGVGMHYASVNGEEITEEVLAPGYSNYQLSSEYRTYDITEAMTTGENVVGVELGNGPAYVRRSVTNPAVGRNSPYSWWQSQPKGAGTLAAPAAQGATNVKLSAVTGYHVGGTINIDTGSGGERLESRRITTIGTAGAEGTGITFTPALSAAHEAGAAVTGSGNNIAASDASAGAAVTPRVIGRVEVTYTDGSTDTVVTDRSWQAAGGALVTDAWYSGSDYDARKELPGWNEPGAVLSAEAKRRDGSAADWSAAGIAPAPNLATELVARDAEPVIEFERFKPQSVTNPAPGTWVFDFGQNFAGWPELNLNRVPAGTTIKMTPAESLNANGTVNPASLMGGGGSRGTNLFNTYTAYGAEGGEQWTPKFNYFGMQWIQVEGLPEGYTPTADLIEGVRLQADTPMVGEFSSSNARINRIHKMAEYGINSQVMTVFTDCPGREKLSYPADYTMPMGAIERNHGLAAYLRTNMHHLVEAQSLAETPMKGNVALKAPVYDWGYSGRFGDEINWGNAIILVPSFLYELYGDTTTMTKYYDNMVMYLDYIEREKAGTGANQHVVDAALADWVSAEQTSGRITGTWGYYLTVQKMAQMADLTNHPADARRYRTLAADIKRAFNSQFLNTELGYYTAQGNAGTTGATQAAQALALDAGLVPAEYRESTVQQLVDDIYAFQPFGGGPHFSGGTIGLAPIIRALADANRDDVLWDILQEDTQPSYGYFMESTPANPNGMTTMGERWTRGDSKNHMILAQIDEWFYSGVAGIRSASNEGKELIYQPKPVGDLTYAEGTYTTPQGTAKSSWNKSANRFVLDIEVPAATTAEVWLPTDGRRAIFTPTRATFDRIDGDYAVYKVGSGTYRFTAPRISYENVINKVDSYNRNGDLEPAAARELRSLLDSAREDATDGKTQQALDSVRAFRTAVAALGDDVKAAVKADLTELGNTLFNELRSAADLPDDAPTSVTPPAIRGTLRVGQTIATSNGTWNQGNLTYTYQWLRNGTPIAGATQDRYKLTSSDLSRRISVQVTAAAAGRDSGSATSAQSTAVAKQVTTARVAPHRSVITEGQRVRLNATVRANGFTPGGRVQFIVNGRNAGTAWLRNGTASLDLTPRAGSYRVELNYLGSSLTEPSKAPARALRVSRR